MKKTFRKAMLSTICMLVVAVMSLTGVTYAWFTQAETADVTGMTMEVAAANGGFMVSKDGTDWVSTINFNETSTKLNPVSTVNAVNFYTAVVNTNDATSKTITTTATDANIWTNTFFAKNTGDTPVTVYLAAGSIFKDIATDDAKEAYKAARIAVFTKAPGASEFTLQYIWGAGEKNLGVKGAGTITDRLTKDDTLIADVSNLKENLADCKFTLPGLVNGVEQVVEVKVVVWVEGQDVDCINKNASDSFAVDLDLTVNEPQG